MKIKQLISRCTGTLSITAIAAISFGMAVFGSASPAMALSGTGILCGSVSNGCWQLNSAGAQVNAIINGIVADQTLTVSPDYLCSGSAFVTASCPFTTGSGLNAALKGHSLVEFYFSHAHQCADSSLTYMIGGDCNGSHAAYVVVNGGNEFISVGGSNWAGATTTNGEIMYPGNDYNEDKPLYLQSYSPPYVALQWQLLAE